MSFSKRKMYSHRALTCPKIVVLSSTCRSLEPPKPPPPPCIECWQWAISYVQGFPTSTRLTDVLWDAVLCVWDVENHPLPLRPRCQSHPSTPLCQPIWCLQTLLNIPWGRRHGYPQWEPLRNTLYVHYLVHSLQYPIRRRVLVPTSQMKTLRLILGQSHKANTCWSQGLNVSVLT